LSNFARNYPNSTLRPEHERARLDRQETKGTGVPVCVEERGRIRTARTQRDVRSPPEGCCRSIATPRSFPRASGLSRRSSRPGSPATFPAWSGEILRPLPVSSTPMIVLAAALSVVKSLRGIGIDAYIRWPNDIIVHGKKICGILAETGVGYTVCGLGLNVNQNYFTPSLAPCATSATRELHKFQSRPRLLRSILEDFEENYDQLLGGEHSEIVERARVRLSSEGSSVNLLGRKTLLTGRISDMGETGHSFSERVAANCSAYFPKMLPGEVGAVEPHSRFPLRETGQ